MVLPDNVPVYVTTPTVSKLIVLPVRLPLMPLIWRLRIGEDSVIVPSSALAVCVNVREKKPLSGPVHSPVHAPLRSGGAWIAVGVGAGMDVGIAVGRIDAWEGGRCKTAIRTPTVAVTATSTAIAAAGLHLCPGGSCPMTSTMRPLATDPPCSIGRVALHAGVLDRCGPPRHICASRHPRSSRRRGEFAECVRIVRK